MDEHEVPMVPKYWAEATVSHMSAANHRLLIALLAVCLTFVITIVVFVTGYTAREKNWLNTLSRMEVQNGVHQQSDQASDR